MRIHKLTTSFPSFMTGIKSRMQIVNITENLQKKHSLVKHQKIEKDTVAITKSTDKVNQYKTPLSMMNSVYKEFVGILLKNQ